MEKLKQLQEKLAAAQAKLGKVFEQAGKNLDFSKVTEISGTDEEKCAKVREMNDDCAKVVKEIEDFRSTDEAYKAWLEREKAGGLPHPSAKKDQEDEEEPKPIAIGKAFTQLVPKGASLKEFYWNKERELPAGVNLKTLFETAAGWAPESIRTGRLVEKAERPIQVIDLIPPGRTSQAAVVYMEETTFTNNATEKAEGSAYGEAALALTERSETVRKIPVFIPVTDEQLEDVPQVQGYLNNRLPFMIRQRLDSQIINGDGIAPNLTGILNKSGTQSYARNSVASDKAVDALRRAMTKVRVTGRAIPSGVIMHPDDWESIRLMKTNDGAYVWGHPSEADLERVWGLPVAQADSIAELTAVVADFRFSELVERRGITLKISDSHDDYFVRGKQAVRADGRWAFVIYRAAAFVEVDLT